MLRMKQLINLFYKHPFTISAFSFIVYELCYPEQSNGYIGMT